MGPAKLEVLAKKNDLEGLYWRGVAEQSGEGGAADPAGAVAWYQKAYQLGYGDAAFALGRLYESGEAGVRSLDQAYRMYSAAEREGGGALRAMAQQMRPLAAGILRPLAAAGNADAQYWLASAEAGAFGWPFNHDDPIRWFRAAAPEGEAESAYQLALLFDRGVDPAGRSLAGAAEKARWLRRAADAGHHDASMALAEPYRSGQGVAADAGEAGRWYQRADRAEAGW